MFSVTKVPPKMTTDSFSYIKSVNTVLVVVRTKLKMLNFEKYCV